MSGGTSFGARRSAFPPWWQEGSSLPRQPTSPPMEAKAIRGLCPCLLPRPSKATRIPALVTVTFSFSTIRIVENERSEEHTSELQSHLNLVCRLLLEKKKSKAQ